MELYQELMLWGDLVKQRESLERFQKEELRRLGREWENSRRQYQALQKEKDSLYEGYAAGQMEAADYRTKADEAALQMSILSCKIEEAGLRYSQLEEEYQHQKQDMKQMIRLVHLEELTQEAVDVFIRKVTVYHDRRVEIEWNYGFGEA